MPVLKIYYDASLDGVIKSRSGDIVAGLEKMMRERLMADPDKCQIIMTPATSISGRPVYVDMQFRSSEKRNRDLVALAMQDIADILCAVTASGVRIRSFDIDQAGLHALDVDERAGI